MEHDALIDDLPVKNMGFHSYRMLNCWRVHPLQYVNYLQKVFQHLNHSELLVSHHGGFLTPSLNSQDVSYHQRVIPRWTTFPWVPYRGSRIDGIFTAPGKIAYQANVIFNDGIRIGGWPFLCHLSVPAPIGIAESLRSIQRNLTYAILVLKKHIGQQFLFPICPPVLGQ